ncbi:MAG TPA: class I SAM-dependent methyltransferase [Myxococcota bacterium]|nr:class I SAM-dependent methyltransferase [Myxococcota bacterium]
MQKMAMICPGCSSERALRLWKTTDRLFCTTDARFELQRCGDCELIYLWPQPSAEELAGYYPRGYWVEAADEREGGLHARLIEAYRRLVLRDHLRFVRRVLDEQVRRGVTPRLLDLGAGDGCFLDALASPSCVGMDVSRDALMALRARGVDAVRGQLGAPPFRSGCFSLVTLFHVLEHVAAPDLVLASVRELLRSDGDLVLQVPNSGSWQAALFGGRWGGLDVPRHLVDYSARTLRRTLEARGFEVVRESHFSLRDNAATLVNSLFPGLYPPARAARRVANRGLAGWLSDFAYLGLTLAAIPFTLLESSFRHGAAVMVHARPRPKTPGIS